MNTLIFTGKLIADAKFVASEKGNFISFTLFETGGKKEDSTLLECTYNWNTAEEGAQSFLSIMKKFASLTVTGTPYAKLGRDKDGNPKAVFCSFIDRVQIQGFADKAEGDKVE